MIPKASKSRFVLLPRVQRYAEGVTQRMLLMTGHRTQAGELVGASTGWPMRGPVGDASAREPALDGLTTWRLPKIKISDNLDTKSSSGFDCGSRFRAAGPGWWRCSGPQDLRVA